MRKFLLDTGGSADNDEEYSLNFNFVRKEVLVKKAMKCKDLEEDNKKLRKLLK